MINYDQEIYDGSIKGGATPSLARLLVAQARNESGNYSNNQTKINNNVFGFKYSTNSTFSKKGNISPEGNPYAKYDTLQDAIQDYIVRWMSKPSKEGGTRLQEFNKIQDGDTLTYARKLKGYGYFGNKSGESDESSIQRYASNMASTLLRVKVVALYLKNEKKINYGLIGVVLLVVSFIAYRFYNKKK